MKNNRNKNRITTNSIRTIKSAFPRFISLLIMSMLGVFVLTGLQSTAPDMKRTLDDFLDKQNTYDIKIVSSMGLTTDDVDALKKIDSVKVVEGSYSKDLLFKTNSDECVINVSSINKNLNNLKLIKGSLPTKANEIVVEENMLTKNNLKIGDQITLNDDSFKENIVTITGTVTSSLYFSSTELVQDRGITSVGTGTISYYSYMLEDNFKDDYYTNIYLTVKDAKSLNTFSNEYELSIEKMIEKLDKLKTTREKARYDSIKKEALEELSINRKSKCPKRT